LGFVSGVPVFVAVGSGGSIFRSSDLLNWTSVSNTTEDLNGVSFFPLGGVFVATGANGTLLTSPDGSTWTAQNSRTGNTLRGVALGLTASGFRYAAVGDAGTIVTSGDGLDWSAVAPPPLAQNLRSVVVGSRFLAVGQDGAVAYSDDGLIWSPASAYPPNPPPPGLNAVIFTPAMYVAVGASGANAVSR
jgi:hypothetical protein